MNKKRASSVKRSDRNLSKSITKSNDKCYTLKSGEVLIDDKNITFDKESMIPIAEQGVGNIFNPDNEIINFETNENPEFKQEHTTKSKRSKKKKRTNRAKAAQELKTTSTFNEKIKEISKILGPLGDGITTNLLDFENINKISQDVRKELKISKADQEYFSGAKKSLFTSKRGTKVYDKFAEESKTNKDDCPLSK